MYKIRREIFKNILEPMIEAYGNPVYKITYYKKNQGYGLKASNFDGKKGCSRRIFSHWKTHLLDRKIIRKPKIKRNLKDKDKDSDRNYPFIITPLGVCSFSSTTDKLVKHDGKKIVEILKYYGENVPRIDWDEICKIITKNTASIILKQICDSINIREVDDEFHIILNYRSVSGINYEKSKFVINDDKVYVQLIESTYTVNVSEDPTTTTKSEIEEELLYNEISDFIIESFCYAIVEKYHWKISNKSRLLNQTDLSPQKKATVRKSISRDKKILEKLPFEIHLSASNFVAYDLFPEIRTEQNIVKAVYGHAFNKTNPKTGRVFVEDFKPADIFPEVSTK